ncbi:fatty acid hydroxylase family protein [Bordetella bronchiseptica CA90 BB1334]|nr:fatty acid hydroxylase family protein [Bordetella bronchiseptica OSU054]KDB74730.1 fatty acid hydroxylase family protein [Bordetella bronchiseptica CA90 BB1334]KDD46799.1 fatty acid hydroxylase family protein [Bordetella bronchiseptica OSU095]
MDCLASLIMDTLTQWFSQCQQWLFEALVQPALFHLGLAGFTEDAYDATMWLLVGLLQLLVLIAVFGPLQRWRPVEPVRDRGQVAVDVVYTLVHRLGLFRLALFFTIDPLWDALFGQMHTWGLATWHLDQIWPGVTDLAWVSLVLYLLVFDAVDYVWHRAQHRVHWLWALHAVHHSQRQMTMWSDNRNHLLDDFLRDAVIVLVSQLVGVPPAQFVAVVAIMQLAESLSHANVRLSFGALGQRLLVGPRFHRRHHSIAYDASEPGPTGGYNFAALFPLWDMLFGTARFDGDYGPTGIHDQLPQAGGRDYGRGFWAQQWLGLRRMAGRADTPAPAVPRDAQA